jgi:hypothetical protein
MKITSLILFALILLNSGLFAQIPNNVPTNGLVGWWPFNGNANDESGNNNNGSGTAVVLSSDRFGNANKAYYFNGINSFITILHSNSIAITNGTINAWVKTTSTQEMQILKKSNYSNASGEQFGLTLNYTPTNKVDWSVKYNSSCNAFVGWRSYFSGTSVADGNWHMITVTINSFSIGLYVDGVFLGSTTTPNSQSDFCTSPLEFGRNWASNLRWYEGDMDDIGMWNRVLTAQEIRILYCGLNNNSSPTLYNTNIGSNINLIANSASAFRWQTNPANNGWQNVSSNSTYNGIINSVLIVNNTTLSNHLQPFRVIETNGICTDTSYHTIALTDTCISTLFDTTSVTVFDTISISVFDTTSISVTDTLIINAVLTGVNPPNNNNTILIYPNPAKTHITIDNGNFGLMNGYTVRISNSLGQIVFSQTITQQQVTIDLSGWTGSGIYYLNILDNLAISVASKVIILQ